MTNDEINQAVAKRLCLRKVHYGEWVDKPGVPVLLHEVVNDDNFNRSWKEVPDYCGDIGAAWEIVEKVGGYGIFFVNYETEDDYQWEVCECNETVLARADTAPMAICLAFLKLP